jgi:tetraacyldisaccharide 4'-kinase
MIGFCTRRVWQRKGFIGTALWLLLLPASAIYLLVTILRNHLYSIGWLPSRSLDRPVISVGNMTVGGTGKTPTVLWLAQRLSARGMKVGILSRGYKRKGKQPIILSSPGNPAHPLTGSEVNVAGDEPAMMACIYGQTVSVAKDRSRAGRELLNRQPIDVFILDDGFQHRKLKRDFDLVLLGSDVPGSVLPAGPFRESKRGLRRADCFLLTGEDPQVWKRLLPANVSQRCFAGSLQPQALIGFDANGWCEHPLTRLYRSKILTVTGIANPAAFYDTIHEFEGEIIETIEFPDHHSYSAADWQRISRVARNLDLVITTEKDILKLMRFPFARGKLLALRVAMAVDGENSFIDGLLDELRNLTVKLT